MGNHIAETTREAAGMSKTILCYAGVSREREDIKVIAKGAATRTTLTESYITIPAYTNSKQTRTEELSK